MVAEQNVTCSLPVYKYQIAPLARGYACAVADRTFILAKGVFLSAISTIVFFGTTRPASGFRYTKPPRPVPPGGPQRGIKIASGTTPKARSGWVRIQDFIWHPEQVA